MAGSLNIFGGSASSCYLCNRITKYFIAMKKAIVLLTIMMGTLTAKASSLPYVTFETTEGAKISISSDAVVLTFSGTTLTAGSESFTLSNLSKVYFSSSDETTGIQQVSLTTLDNITAIYDMQGHRVEKDQMRQGVYIVKTTEGTHKIIVK